jgi:glycosyltransferase involved in cell wall biosynthesis
MLGYFDGCIGLSESAERFFKPRDIPFLWMPGGCTPERAPADNGAAGPGAEEPIRFAYFGALAPHSGIVALVEGFAKSSMKASLHVCGFGGQASVIEAAAARDPRIVFHGFIKPDCLNAAREWDVLVNPRPATHGNENNFPSKIFEYSLCGRAILTTKMAGVEVVLGDEAFYADAGQSDTEVIRQMEVLSKLPRSELRRRGAALRARVLGRYSWAAQAAAMAGFMEKLPAEVIR